MNKYIHVQELTHHWFQYTSSLQQLGTGALILALIFSMQQLGTGALILALVSLQLSFAAFVTWLWFRLKFGSFPCEWEIFLVHSLHFFKWSVCGVAALLYFRNPPTCKFRHAYLCRLMLAHQIGVTTYWGGTAPLQLFITPPSPNPMHPACRWVIFLGAGRFATKQLSHFQHVSLASGFSFTLNISPCRVSPIYIIYTVVSVVSRTNI